MREELKRYLAEIDAEIETIQQKVDMGGEIELYNWFQLTNQAHMIHGWLLSNMSDAELMIAYIDASLVNTTLTRN